MNFSQRSFLRLHAHSRKVIWELFSNPWDNDDRYNQYVRDPFLVYFAASTSPIEIHTFPEQEMNRMFYHIINLSYLNY